VLHTAKPCQLVIMAGEAVLDGVRTPIRAGFAVVVPAGANHNIINTGSVPLKLYTLYAPPNHRDGTEAAVSGGVSPADGRAAHAGRRRAAHDSYSRPHGI
jgi:uncharacterized cupin superfamily protein